MRHRAVLAMLPKGYTLGWPIEDRGDNQEDRKLGGKNGHLYVLRPDGKPLRRANGLPLKIACSPTGRTERNDIARIRQALRESET